MGSKKSKPKQDDPVEAAPAAEAPKEAEAAPDSALLPPTEGHPRPPLLVFSAPQRHLQVTLIIRIRNIVSFRHRRSRKAHSKHFLPARHLFEGVGAGQRPNLTRCSLPPQVQHPELAHLPHSSPARLTTRVDISLLPESRRLWKAALRPHRPVGTTAAAAGGGIPCLSAAEKKSRP